MLLIVYLTMSTTRGAGEHRQIHQAPGEGHQAAQRRMQEAAEPHGRSLHRGAVRGGGQLRGSR